MRDCQGAACLSGDLSPEPWSWRPALGMWCSAHASTLGTWAEWRRWMRPNMMLREARSRMSTMSSISGLNLTVQTLSSRMGTGKNVVFGHPGQFESKPSHPYVVRPQTVTTKLEVHNSIG